MTQETYNTIINLLNTTQKTAYNAKELVRLFNNEGHTLKTGCFCKQHNIDNVFQVIGDWIQTITPQD